MPDHPVSRRCLWCTVCQGQRGVCKIKNTGAVLGLQRMTKMTTGRERSYAFMLMHLCNNLVLSSRNCCSSNACCLEMLPPLEPPSCASKCRVLFPTHLTPPHFISFHSISCQGVDLAAEEGEPIAASRTGTVTFTGEEGV